MVDACIAMEHSLIHNADEAVRRFLDEWFDDSPYITAMTSGSTGVPKPIRLSKDDMLRSARATLQYLGIKDGSTFVMPLSAGYIAGKMMVVRALESSSRLYVEKPTNRPLASASHHGDAIGLVPIVPSQIEGLLSSPAIGRIENVIVGGAPMSVVQERMLIDSGVRAFATYGMTETCSHVAMRPVGDEEFEAMPGVEFTVDSDGCLVIHASGFSYGELHTNDVVSLADSCHFRWLGRRDNVINSGGIKIHPEEVERRIMKQMGDVTFYITSRESGKWGSEAVLVVDREIDSEVVMAEIERILPRTHLPKDIIVDPCPVYTSSGKLKRKKF